MVCDRDNHGGEPQAVYAYARADLDYWEPVLGRALPGGGFGENLTTTGLDVDGAVIGERWRIGDELELAVTVPRIPCGTFRGWIAERGWLRTFTRAARPGTYLSVVSPGKVRAGDPVTIVHRPAHGSRRPGLPGDHLGAGPAALDPGCRRARRGDQAESDNRPEVLAGLR